ncbi:MAG: hypothetical protein ABI647_20300, partial [Gemmatimonadota bacterium]
MMDSRYAGLLLIVGCTGGTAERPAPRYQDLSALFQEWRRFQQPKLVEGVPDYSPAAMAAQRQELAVMQERLAAIDTAGWSIPQQVDYRIVKAEMNGLDFDHRVLQPWARNPAFYVTVFPDESDQPAREGPVTAGAIELWSYRFPLAADDARKVGDGLRTIPKLLEQSRTNLVGNAKDLWVYGTRSIRQQSADLAALSPKVQGTALAADVARAKEATDSFAVWLDRQAGSKTEPS